MVFRSVYSSIKSIEDIEKIIKPALFYIHNFVHVTPNSEINLWGEDEFNMTDILQNIDRVYYINNERVCDPIQTNPELFKVERSGDSYDIIGRLNYNETYKYFQYKVELYYDNFSQPSAGFLLLSKDGDTFMRCVLRNENWIDVEAVLQLLLDDNISISWPLDPILSNAESNYQKFLKSDEWQNLETLDVNNHKKLFRKNKQKRRTLMPNQPQIRFLDEPLSATREINCRNDVETKLNVIMQYQQSFQMFGVRHEIPGVTIDEYRNFYLSSCNIDHIYHFRRDDSVMGRTNYEFAGRTMCDCYPDCNHRSYFYVMASTFDNLIDGRIFISTCPNTFRDYIRMWKSSEPINWKNVEILYNRDSIQDTRTENTLVMVVKK